MNPHLEKHLERMAKVFQSPRYKKERDFIEAHMKNNTSQAFTDRKNKAILETPKKKPKKK